MSMCPLCNGLTNSTYKCNVCNHKVSDQGKLMDYFDDYSAYLDSDGMKKADGFMHDLEQHQCPHIFYCDSCHKETVILIQEIKS